MTILITGGVGYIGSLLIRELAESEISKGHTIRILDNFTKERYNSIMDLPTQRKYEFIEGDIRDEKVVEKAMKGVDIVYDLAGITNAPISFERRDLTIDVNCNGCKILVNEAIHQKVKRYIYLSSCSVYGPAENLVDENFPCKPSSPYAETKLMAEEEVMDAYKNGLNITILRCATVYGFSIGMRFDTLIDKFVYLACTNQPLSVYEEAYKLKRPYIHIKDIIRAILFVTEKKETYGKVYNVVGQNASVEEVVNFIKKYCPYVKVEYTPTKYLNQLSFVVDGSKINKIGFKSKYTIAEGVEEMINKFKSFL